MQKISPLPQHQPGTQGGRAEIDVTGAANPATFKALGGTLGSMRH